MKILRWEMNVSIKLDSRNPVLRVSAAHHAAFCCFSAERCNNSLIRVRINNASLCKVVRADM